jgi:hypothetical protein
VVDDVLDPLAQDPGHAPDRDLGEGVEHDPGDDCDYCL